MYNYYICDCILLYIIIINAYVYVTIYVNILDLKYQTKQTIESTVI